MAFSSPVTQWLAANRSFVNDPEVIEDRLAMRSLGPGSGTIGDLYPFTEDCAYRGLFAGLSLSGFSHDIAEDLRVTRFNCRYGFRPAQSGPFSGNGWQVMSAQDWIKISPSSFPSSPNVGSTVHEADITLSAGSVVYSTSLWDYTSRLIGKHYKLYFWWKRDRKESLSIALVTFRTRNENIAPFLRPRWVDGESAPIDPVCLFPSKKMARLFDGLTVLSEGNLVHLAVDESDSLAADDASRQLVSAGLVSDTQVTTVRISRDPIRTTDSVRSIMGVTPSLTGGISLASTGTHRISVPYEEINLQERAVKLQPATLQILSQETPCCTCEEYVEAYEKLRELFAKQSYLIEKYNELFQILCDVRDEIESKFRDARQPIHIRRNSYFSRTNSERVTSVYMEYALIYSSLRENERVLDPMTYEYTFDTDQGAVTSILVRDVSEGLGFRILSHENNTFHVPSLTLQPYTHKTATLIFTVVLTDGVDVDEFVESFVLDVLPLPEEPDPEEPDEEPDEP